MNDIDWRMVSVWTNRCVRSSHVSSYLGRGVKQRDGQRQPAVDLPSHARPTRHIGSRWRGSADSARSEQPDLLCCLGNGGEALQVEPRATLWSVARCTC